MKRLFTILSLMSCILLCNPGSAIAQTRGGTSQVQQQEAARRAEAERKAREEAARREREAAAKRAREEEARRQREREEQARRERERQEQARRNRERQEAEARAQREREEQARRNREREERAQRERERQEAADRAQRERQEEARRERERAEAARREREQQEAINRAEHDRKEEARRERERQEAADRAEREEQEATRIAREKEAQLEREREAQAARNRAEREREAETARENTETVQRPTKPSSAQQKPAEVESTTSTPSELKPSKETTSQTKPTSITNSSTTLTRKPQNEMSASTTLTPTNYRPTDRGGADWVLQAWTPAKIPPYDQRPGRPAAMVTDHQLQTIDGNTTPGGNGNTGGNGSSGSGSGSGSSEYSGGYYGGYYYDDDFFYNPPVCPPNTYAVPIYDPIIICPIDNSYYFYSPPYVLIDCIEQGLKELAFMEQHANWASITFLCEFKRVLDRVRSSINCLPVWWDAEYYLHDWNYFNDVYHYYNFGGNPEGFVSKDRGLFLEYESFYDVKSRLLPNLIMEMPCDSVLNETTNTYEYYIDSAKHIFIVDTTFGDYWGGLEYHDLVVAFNPEDVRAGLKEGKRFNYLLAKTKGYQSISTFLDTFSQSYFCKLLFDKVVRDHQVVTDVIKDDKEYATYISANMHYLIKAILMVDPQNLRFTKLKQQNDLYLQELNWTEEQPTR